MAQVALDPIEIAYRRLRRRRFFIWCARIGLPFIAFVAIVGIVSNQFATKILEQIIDRNIRFNPDGVVIKSPRFEGILSNGLSYILDSGDVIYGIIPKPTVTLQQIDAKLFTPDNMKIDVKTDQAIFLVNENKVSLDGRVELQGDDGSKGYFIGGNLALSTQIFTSEGPLYFEMPCGSSINAASGTFNSADAKWTFQRAQVLIIQNEEDGNGACLSDKTPTN